MKNAPEPTRLYPVLWRFAAERHAVYQARLRNLPEPWTADPVIRRHRFTNAFRAADRVSQRLIRIQQESRKATPRTVMLRTVLFKLFNRESTWDAIVAGLRSMPEDLDSNYRAIVRILDQRAKARPLYNAAYLIPPGPTIPKYHWHVELAKRITRSGLAERLADCAAADVVKTAYTALLEHPSMGPFLSFQIATDIGYAETFAADESRFVVAGPGALDGLSKCFAPATASALDPADTILWMTERQEDDARDAGALAPTLWGRRRLQPVDVQNLLCEISKYTRATHPEVAGASGRTKIKQRFQASGPLPEPVFPEHWGVNDAVKSWLTETRAGGDEQKATAGQASLPFG